MPPPFQPFREPLRATLLRTVSIALIAGAVIAWRLGGIPDLPLATLLALWFSLGGHYAELLFLNVLRPRLSPHRPVHVAVRVIVWFIAGVGLMGMMRWTVMLAGRGPVRWPAWWLGGMAFIAIELVVHGVAHVRGRPSFYDGRR